MSKKQNDEKNINDIEDNIFKNKNFLIIIFTIILIIVLTIIIYPNKETYILRKYRSKIYSLNELDNLEIRLARNRETYNETQNLVKKLGNKYLNRYNINTFEYVNFDEDKFITYYEKDKKYFETNTKNHKEKDIYELMYIPLLKNSEKEKVKNLKVEETKYGDKETYKFTFEKDNLECFFHIEKENLEPLTYGERLLNSKDDKKYDIYDYTIRKNSVSEKDFEKAKQNNYQKIEKEDLEKLSN